MKPEAQGEAQSNNNLVTAPSLSLPKGGGAIRGIGEKFSANPATGAGSFSVPLPVSPGRSGFQPQLAIQYDSGSGNGPFGIGWSLSSPAITRKTEKGIPRYEDSRESDVFLLAGAEDLVPVTDPASGAMLEPQSVELAGQTYQVRCYRPRVEGLFALIEKWSSRDLRGESFWRVLDRANITQWFGRTAASRIADPTDPTRIFQWLPCETYDDKGNAIIYEYLADNADAIDTQAAWEVQRTAIQRQSQRYLKRVRYGNRTPYLPRLLPDGPLDFLPAEWLFEVVFDYGDHSTANTSPIPDRVWSSRADSFSNHRPGFELRTTRRCERVLMFHHIEEIPGLALPAPTIGLVRSMRFVYSPGAALENPLQSGYSTLTAVQSTAHQVRSDGQMASRDLPPVEFTYSVARVDSEVRILSTANLKGLPVGTQGPGVHWVDLDGEGLSGVLTDAAGTWCYAANLGDGKFAPSRAIARMPARRTLAQGAQRLMDLNGNGAIDVVELDAPMPGYHERTAQGDWQEFVPFSSLPHIRWDDPNLRFVDLTGDGHADALITEDEVFTWYPSLAESGFAAAEYARTPLGEDGVRLLFAEGTQTLLVADMCGDGLTDIVRIRNGEICYWPNLGYGRFGRKVQMSNAPYFDFQDMFDPRRIRLVDIDGSGPTDILYLGREGAQLYFNRSGNMLSDPTPIRFPVATHNLDSVQVVDLLGRGTACLVWNSHLLADSDNPIRYIDLMGGVKPHLLIGSRNNLGGSTEIEYTSSTHYYLADKAAGTPWITRLPFPVQCVSRVTQRDAWRGTAFSSTYSYHHGHFDGDEREFRGFGRVEQLDIEDYGRFAEGNPASPWITHDQRLFQPPIKSVTWYHTGVVIDRHNILAQFKREYFPARYSLGDEFQERELPEPELDPTLTSAERAEALRACKGMVLRQEVYELDIEGLAAVTPVHTPVRLYSAATHNCRIQCLQARGTNRHAVFLVTESEALSYQYELPLPARGGRVRPDPRIAHTLTLRVDEYGQPLQSVAVAYPRVGQFTHANLDAATISSISQLQREIHLAYTETQFTRDVLLRSSASANSAIRYRRLRLPCEVRSCELSKVAHRATFYYQLADFASLRLSDIYPPVNTTASPIDMLLLPYHRLIGDNSPQRRLVEQVRTLYFDDAQDSAAPVAALPFGQQGPRGLKYEDYKLALTSDLLDAVFKSPPALDMPEDMLAWELKPGVSARSLLNNSRVSGYERGEDLALRFTASAATAELTGQYWLRSGIAGFAEDAPRNFFLPERYTDPFGAVTQLEYDALSLYAQSVTDARGNRTEVLRFDHRTLMPVEMLDANGNHTEACVDILGQVIAVAAKGKLLASGWEGDNLEAFHASSDLVNLSVTAVQDFCFATTLDEAQARIWLASASSRFVYHFGEAYSADGSLVWATKLPSVCSIAREVHTGQPGGDTSPLQVSLQCSDGGGNVLMAKQQAEPETDGGSLRWIVNGLTLLNNKGKPVKQYEPFFSANFGCELPREEGVTPIIFYDAAGRVIRTDLPDGTFSCVEFSPWYSLQFDASDTVLESPWYAGRTTTAANVEDRRAAQLSALHANTPGLALFDSLGRAVIAVAHNRSPSDAPEFRHLSFIDRPWVDELQLTHTKLDTEGKPLWVRDARGKLVMQYIFPHKPVDEWSADELPENSVPCYDIAGNLLYQHSMDAGDRWSLSDAAGKPLLLWDINDKRNADGELQLEACLGHTEYDLMHRPLRQWLRLGAAPAAVVESFEYCDTAGLDAAALDNARAHNLIGQAVRHYDPSGRMELQHLNFTGQVQHEQRRLALHTTAAIIDWQGTEATRESLLEAEVFTRLNEHDALGRMTQLINWHSNLDNATDRLAMYRPQYNARGLLVAEDLSIGARFSGGRLVSSRKTIRAVHGITYNAKGQRMRLRHGNGTETLYAYDPQSFRLKQLRTTRPATRLPFPGFRSNLNHERVLQQLHYTYDAIGNISEIMDEAWAPVFFRNQSVKPRNSYVYDAQQRLIEATGRESAELVIAPGAINADLIPGSFPSDQNLRDYTQRYYYDSVGNFLQMQHMTTDDNWTRHYETADSSNRLLRTWTGTDDIDAIHYRYDIHGSILNFANVPTTAQNRRDWRDMIQNMDLGGGGQVWYSYDTGKQRMRKRIERLSGAIEERLYLGGMELYRRYSPAGVLEEEIDTHHLFVDDQRALMVDDVISTDNAVLGEGVLCKYQYSNHLGSVALELDETAQIIGCEELHPYGTTAYQLVGSGVRATAKRYRYTGMERDEESGLSYHTARYYLPWLGRWGSSDPVGMGGGINLFCYTNCNPIFLVDSNGAQARAPAILTFVDPSVSPFDPRILPRIPEDLPVLDLPFLTEPNISTVPTDSVETVTPVRPETTPHDTATSTSVTSTGLAVPISSEESDVISSTSHAIPISTPIAVEDGPMSIEPTGTEIRIHFLRIDREGNISSIDSSNLSVQVINTDTGAADDLGVATGTREDLSDGVVVFHNVLLPENFRVRLLVPGTAFSALATESGTSTSSPLDVDFEGEYYTLAFQFNQRLGGVTVKDEDTSTVARTISAATAIGGTSLLTETISVAGTESGAHVDGTTVAPTINNFVLINSERRALR
ncbi:MAG: SpvB/TcaC N-terminal domain-containing protein [Pseudomonadota bacterium]